MRLNSGCINHSNTARKKRDGGKYLTMIRDEEEEPSLRRGKKYCSTTPTKRLIKATKNIVILPLTLHYVH